MVFEIDGATINLSDDFMKEVIREHFDIQDLFTEEEIEKVHKVKGEEEYRVVSHPIDFARILFNNGYGPVEREEHDEGTWVNLNGVDILPEMWNYLGARVIPTGDGDFVTEGGVYYFPKEFVEIA